MGDHYRIGGNKDSIKSKKMRIRHQKTHFATLSRQCDFRVPLQVGEKTNCAEKKHQWGSYSYPPDPGHPRLF
jgi:hypothetical protein